MGFLTKTKTIPASRTFQELENVALPAGMEAYNTLANTPMQALSEQEGQGLFGNADLYALQKARGEAVSPMGKLAGFTDPQQQALQQMSLGNAGYSDQFSGDLFNQYLSKYQDPYQEQVIDPTLANIREQGDIGQSRLGEAATNAGGFGGTRQALQSAMLEGETQRNIANVGSQMRSQGLNSSMDRAFRDYMSGQDVYSQGLQKQLGAGNIIQQQNQRGLDVAQNQITQPAEWYQQFLTGMPSSMITPEQKIEVGTGLSKALGAASSIGGMVSGMGGFGGIGDMLGIGGAGATDPFGGNAPIPQFKPMLG